MNWVEFNKDDKSTWPLEGAWIIGWSQLGFPVAGAFGMHGDDPTILQEGDDNRQWFMTDRYVLIVEPAHKSEVCDPTHIRSEGGDR